MTLVGKAAVVTGASRGIGRAIAVILDSEGADRVVAANTSAAAQATADEIVALGHKAVAVKCDVTDSKEVESLVGAAVTAFGKLDIPVNNSGMTRAGLLLRMKEEEWQ